MEQKQENNKINNSDIYSLKMDIQSNEKEFIDLKFDNLKLNNIHHLDLFFQENKFYHFQLHYPDLKINNDLNLKFNFHFQKNIKASFFILVNKPNNYFINLFLKEKAIVEVFLINIHDHDIKISINATLNGKESNLKIYSLSILKSSIKDQYINVIHKADKSCAKITSYDICLGKAQIKNRIINIVPKNIKYCSSHQSIKCLNFNNLATIINDPILSIYNNDVDSSHGCAVGDINMNEFLYIYSRGFNKKQIQKIVTLGYSVEILKNLYDINLETKILEIIKPRIYHFFHDKN